MIVYSASQRFMAPPSPDKSPAGRPSVPRSSSSLSQHDRDDTNGQKPPRRAQTFPSASPLEEKDDASDAFENNNDSDDEDGVEGTRASIELDVLPIELITLTDRYAREAPF